MPWGAPGVQDNSGALGKGKKRARTVSTFSDRDETTMRIIFNWLGVHDRLAAMMVGATQETARKALAHLRTRYATPLARSAA